MQKGKPMTQQTHLTTTHFHIFASQILSQICFQLELSHFSFAEKDSNFANLRMEPWGQGLGLVPREVFVSPPALILLYTHIQLEMNSVCYNINVKHLKNCECCPLSLLIVRWQRLSWIQVLNFRTVISVSNVTSLQDCLFNCQNFQKLSKLSKIVKNCQKL